MRRYLLTAALFAALACSNSTAADDPLLVVETSRHAYVTGDTINVVTRNIGAVALTYGLCRSELERHAGNRWVGRSQLPAGSACLDIGHRLAPGDTASNWIVLARDAPVGVFRLVVPFTVNGETGYRPRTRASNLFFVRGAP